MYDHSIFIDDVYIYIDILGDYIIVEPYQMIKGCHTGSECKKPAIYK